MSGQLTCNNFNVSNVLLVGNKTDRDDREVPCPIGEEFAKQHGMYFLETSAKQSDNVERLFYEIAAELIEQARQKGAPRSVEMSSSTNLGTKPSYQTNCCGGGGGG